MMKNKKLILGILVLAIAGIVLISGCIEKECETDSDCLTKTCFTAECTDNKCVYVSLNGKQPGCSEDVTCGGETCKEGVCEVEYEKNCCGNEICEVGETYPECVADCPNCDDKNNCTVDEYDYHEQKCINIAILDVVCCGNGLCELGETYSNCTRDCPNCDDENNCTADSYDYHEQKCVNEIIIPCCGNGICDEGVEDYSSCSADCPDCDDGDECTEDSYNYQEQKCVNEIIVPCCGNSICDEGVEDLSNCSVDCPDCDDNDKMTGDSFNYKTQECEYVTYCFFEDFNEGNASWELAPEWSVVFPEDETNGMLVSSGRAITRFGDPSWRDYNFSFKLKPGAGLHIGIRKSSDGSYDLVISDSEEAYEEGQLYLHRGKSSFGVMKGYPINPDQFYDIKIELKGSNIKVYIDDNLEIDATDEDNPILSGNVGFDTFHKAYFDDIKVEGPCSANVGVK